MSKQELLEYFKEQEKSLEWQKEVRERQLQAVRKIIEKLECETY